jgi:hypothetical protein
MNSQIHRSAVTPVAGLALPRPAAASRRADALRSAAAFIALRPAPRLQALGRRSRSLGVTVSAAASAVEPFAPQVCVVIGTQWGDEGKGKLVDILARQYDIIARAQVGAYFVHSFFLSSGCFVFRWGFSGGDAIVEQKEKKG